MLARARQVNRAPGIDVGFSQMCPSGLRRRIQDPLGVPIVGSSPTIWMCFLLGVTQLVECLTVVQVVVGSSPAPEIPLRRYPATVCHVQLRYVSTQVGMRYFSFCESKGD